MSAEISQRELRNDSGRIMRALIEGETFIVTRNGEPIGELTPLRRHRFVRAEAAIELFRNAPAVDYERLRRDLDDITVGMVSPDGRQGMIEHAAQFAEAGIPFIFDPGQGMPMFGTRTYSLHVPGAPTYGPWGKNGLVGNDEFVCTQIGQVGTQCLQGLCVRLVGLPAAPKDGVEDQPQ